MLQACALMSCGKLVHSLRKTSMCSHRKHMQPLHEASMCFTQRLHMKSLQNPQQTYVVTKHCSTQSALPDTKHRLFPVPAGVARAIRILSAVVTVRPPAEFISQRSSQEGLSAMDTSSISSASPGGGSQDRLDGHKRNSTQVVTAHDNGQVQVWDMSTGFLQPVLRMGVVGPSARCAILSLQTTSSLHRSVERFQLDPAIRQHML